MDNRLPASPPHPSTAFDEAQWVKQLFLLSDMANYLCEAEQSLFYALPVKHKKQLLRKSFRLSVTALAHILEKHFFKIQRHPHAGKFTLPVADIIELLREASTQEPQPINGSIYLQRVTDTGRIIGFDRAGISTSIFTVITDGGGRIITAFPGGVQR